MFETSKDILYLIISFCILWVTVFLCWMFYYVMRLLRDATQIVEEFRVRLQTLTEAIGYIRGKVENISSLFTVATEGAAGLVKKAVTKKANAWMDHKSDDLNSAAKDAVSKAAAGIAKKMKKTAKKIKR